MGVGWGGLRWGQDLDDCSGDQNKQNMYENRMKAGKTTLCE